MNPVKKRPEVTVRKVSIGKRAARIIGWVEEDGGFALPCGCFIGASAKDLRILVAQSGPETVVDIVKYLEIEHSNCK
jgi:hypothetical protein